MTRRTRYIWLTVVLGCGVAIAGCREAPSPTNPEPAPVPKTYSAEEQKAVDAATAFLAKHSKDWGRPTKVERTTVEYIPGLKGEGVYWVAYPTPDEEMKLLGDRVVLVDITSGRTEFLPRK